MAVKFDLFSNAGEGPNSTCLYTDGAVPTVPAVNLTPTGINLHSGDTFNAAFTYNGTTLTVVITDTVTNISAAQTYTVEYPAFDRCWRVNCIRRIYGRRRWIDRNSGHPELDLQQRELND